MTRSLYQDETVIIPFILVILHYRDRIAVGPDRCIHVDAACLHGRAGTLRMGAPLQIAFTAHPAWPGPQAEGLVVAGQENLALQLAGNAGGTGRVPAMDQQCVFVTADHLPRFQVGRRVRGATETRVVAAAPEPAFHSHPWRRDDAFRFHQLRLNCAQFTGTMNDRLDILFGHLLISLILCSSPNGVADDLPVKRERPIFLLAGALTLETSEQKINRSYNLVALLLERANLLTQDMQINAGQFSS